MNLSLCLQLKDDIFKLDDRIRYFGFMDNRQGMVVSELRDPRDSHPGESQLVRDLTFFKGAMASWSIYFGHVQYAVVSHDAFKIVMIPVEAGLVIITAESSFPVDNVETVSKAVRRFFS
ncbi:MAG: hypothetical protein JRN20_10430 [Nitrososphaerota archaeon]|nr:hypothetical protein [Nitrososphaerota archaeon]